MARTPLLLLGNSAVFILSGSIWLGGLFSLRFSLSTVVHWMLGIHSDRVCSWIVMFLVWSLAWLLLICSDSTKFNSDSFGWLSRWNYMTGLHRGNERGLPIWWASSVYNRSFPIVWALSMDQRDVICYVPKRREGPWSWLRCWYSTRFSFRPYTAAYKIKTMILTWHIG